MKTELAVACLLGIGLVHGCGSIVYVHRPTPSDQVSQWGYAQIYHMNMDGSNKENLSNRNRHEVQPDVRHDGGKIVFLAEANQITVMDTDGANVSPVPNGPNDAGTPRWSRGQGGGWFILFSHPASYAGTAIYRINPDGTGLTKITSPGPHQRDGAADSIDDKHIVFSRYDQANNDDRDLYVKYLWDHSPEVRLTNTPNQSETLPVVSHNGKMLAYRVLRSGHDDQIHVAQFVTETSITVMHVIDLALPAETNISGIDFSPQDNELLVSVQVTIADVPTNAIQRRQEIFRVRRDGSEQYRLTTNADEDVYPSALP